MKKTVLLIGGHMSPLLATINVLQEDPDISLAVISRRHATEGDKSPSQESVQFAKMGLPVYFLTTGRLQRAFTIHTIPSLLKIPIGFVQAFFLLRRIKPRVVVSFGGYLSVPVVIAAWVYRVPILTHEQSVHAGLANKINSLFATIVAISWENSRRYFPAQKTILTGNPIRPEIFASNAADGEIKEFLHRCALPLIYITGGNQGSHAINQAIFGLLPDLLMKFAILHQTGKSAHNDYQKANDTIQALSSELKPRYLPIEYVHSSDIGAVLAKASLVISRSGANTICELAALGKTAILVPLPWAQKNEQYENATLLKNAGTAEIVLQGNDFTKRLMQTITAIVAKYDDYQKNAGQAKQLIKLDAAENIATQIRSLVAS